MSLAPEARFDMDFDLRKFCACNIFAQQSIEQLFGRAKGHRRRPSSDPHDQYDERI